jgi:DUF1009 family protein
VSARRPKKRSGAVTRGRTPEKAAGPIGIICGGGSIPLAVANAVEARGRPVMLFPLHGFADKAVERFPHQWVHLGAVGRLLSGLRKAGCRDVVLIGSLVRPRPWHVRFDLTTVFVLAKLVPHFRGGDDRLLKAVAAMFEERGFRLLGAHEVAPEILMNDGVAGRVQPDVSAKADIEVGRKLLQAIGPYDVGQAVAVANRHVVAVEAAEGTAGMLARVAEMRGNGRLKLSARTGVLVKAPKSGQDRRVDLPAIGPDTVAQAKAAGLAGIAVEAGSTVVADASALIRAADKAGLFVLGFPPKRARRG